MSAYLRPADVDKVVLALQKAWSSDQADARSSRAALQDAAVAAKAPEVAGASEDSKPFDRHLYVFALAATNGAYTPASELVRRVRETVDRDRRAMRMLRVLAVLRFFAPWSKGVSEDDDLAASTSLEVRREFNKLVVPSSRQNHLRFAHPFLAGILLSQVVEDFDWTHRIINSSSLMKLWTALSEDWVSEARSIANASDRENYAVTILCHRPEGYHFSLFVGHMLEAVKVAHSKEASDAVLDGMRTILSCRHVQNGALGDLVLSRVCRVLATLP
jgi:hypothetical protein